MSSAVFMGTPEAAVPSLEALHSVADIRLVVTRPDRGRGRSRRVQPPPVKKAAERLGLEVAQPENRAALGTAMEGRSFDVGIVVAFGMILPPDVLAVPHAGFLNVHFSLLPRWRGAAPVERAVMAGDTETGVTVMVMDEGLDTGPIVAQRATTIAPEETGGSLRTRLAKMGADLLAGVVPAWVAGELETESQPDRGASYASRLETADLTLDSSMSAERAAALVRALAPDRGARLEIDGVVHKILGVRPHGAGLAPGSWGEIDHRPVRGFIDGALEILTIQPPGKKPMSGEAWLRGRPLPVA
ncbi:MAG TPA: methionyl-tRNA formyltransferase [Acidimicrobiia bacterium]|nr:methionyl-tRNA formyltransferase [Acidimicrobiia bacterium]